MSRPSTTRSHVSSDVGHGRPAVAEGAGRVERGVAVEGGAEQAHGVGLVVAGQGVAPQRRARQLGVARAGAGGGGRRVERQPGGGVATGVPAGVAAPDAADGRQRGAPADPGQGVGDQVGGLVQGQQRDPGAHVGAAAHVRVEAGGGDPEVLGERGQRHPVEPDVVGEVGGRLRHPGARESCAWHGDSFLMT